MTLLLRSAVTLGLVLGASTASAMSFTYSLIGGTKSGFTTLAAPGVTSQGVGFLGADASGETGVGAESSGGTNAVAQSGSSVARGSGASFVQTGNPSGARGVRGGEGGHGFFTYVGGTTLQSFGNTVRFRRIGAPAAVDATPDFSGQTSGVVEVYVSNGSAPVQVAANNTPAPVQAGNFPASGNPNPDVGRSPELVVDEDSTLSVSGTTVAGLDDPSLGGGEVVVSTAGSGGDDGIYTGGANDSVVVVDNNAVSPDSSETSGAPFLENGLVAFSGTGSGGSSGLFVTNSGVLDTVVGLGDELGGTTVDNLILSRGGLDNGSLTFLAGFSDGSGAIVVASAASAGGSGPAVPAPASLGLLVLGLALLRVQRSFGSKA